MASHKLSITRLIREVRKRPALYDDNLEENKDAELKAAIWIEITQSLFQKNDPILAEKLKFKWKNLKDGFSRAHKVFVKKKMSKIHARPPKYNGELNFILPYIKSRKKFSLDGLDDTVDSNEFPPEIDMEDIIQERRGDPLTFEKYETFDKYEKKHDPSKVEIHIENPISSDFILNTNSNHSDGGTSAIFNVSSSLRVGTDADEEELETFFRSIAKTVRRLTPLHQAIVKKTIVNIVLDVEIKEAKERAY